MSLYKQFVTFIPAMDELLKVKEYFIEIKN
jgi:hypothetical protein